MARITATTVLRQMFQDGVSLSAFFNAEGAAAGRTSELDSGQSDIGKAKAGQVSLFGLRPVSLGEKLQHLKQMIAKGKVSIPSHVSLESIRNELKKPEHDGLGVKEMVSVLTEKKLLALKSP